MKLFSFASNKDISKNLRKHTFERCSYYYSRISPRLPFFFSFVKEIDVVYYQIKRNEWKFRNIVTHQKVK